MDKTFQTNPNFNKIILKHSNNEFVQKDSPINSGFEHNYHTTIHGTLSLIDNVQYSFFYD